EQKLKEANAVQQQKASPVAAASSNPFADSSPVSSSQTTNLFGSPTEPSMPVLSASSKPSDDLLSLTGNPFMDSVQNVMTSAYPQASNNPFGAPVFQTNGFTATTTTGNAFSSDADFAMAFNNGVTGTQGLFSSPAGTSGKAPPAGLDLYPLDLLESSGGPAVSPSPGLSTDFAGLAPQPSPVPTPHSLGGSLSGLEGTDPMRASPVPSPVGGFAAPLGGRPLQGFDAGSFGGSGFGTGMPGGLVGSSAPQGAFYGQPSVPANMMGQGMMQTHGYYQNLGHSMPVNISGPIGPRSVGVAVPGSPNLGMGGSPVRIMTRGGKSPAASLSSSPSGPGLEDAVRALGLTMSPSRGGADKTGTKPASRPLSPGQQFAGMSTSQASGAIVDTSFGGDMIGFGGHSTGQGVQEQESASLGSGFDAFGDVLQPVNKPSASPSHTSQIQQTQAIGKDLDTSLASLASNLSVRGAVKKDHQWQPKGESKLTGGNAFQRQPMAPSTTTAWGGQPGFQQPSGMMGAPMMYNQPVAAPMGQPMMGMGQPMGMGMGMHPGMSMQAPGMYGAQRMPMMGGFQQPRLPQQQPGQSSNVNDPFGAL
ncbi:unnamed protein product, partial [Candidula unifasciata]